MAKITLEVPDESEQLTQLGESLRHSYAYRLPELLALGLQQSPLPAHIY